MIWYINKKIAPLFQQGAAPFEQVFEIVYMFQHGPKYNPSVPIIRIKIFKPSLVKGYLKQVAAEFNQHAAWVDSLHVQTLFRGLQAKKAGSAAGIEDPVLFG